MQRSGSRHQRTDAPGRSLPAPALALLALLVLVLAPGAAKAQSAVDAFNTLGALTVSAVQSGAGLLTNLVLPNSPPGQLPRCQSTTVLLNRGGFPAGWGGLSANEQAAHPINEVMFMLASVVYSDPAAFSACLRSMGADVSSMRFIEGEDPLVSSRIAALVFKAADERIFVVFRGTNDLENWWTDLWCRHTDRPLGGAFGAAGKDVRLHNGFWRGWQAIQGRVDDAVRQLLKQVPSGKVYMLGHSLGASLASIAALQLQASLPRPAEVAGVWLIGSPRTGNGAWAEAYNAALMHKTLRISNFKDFAVRLPLQANPCAVLPSGVAKFAFSHVGRSLLMCPSPGNGLTQWVVEGGGSERVDCSASGKDGPDTSAATHMLGTYLDAWRRGYVATKGSSLSADPRTLAVQCQECSQQMLTRVGQITAPVRTGGPVTCTSDAGCSNRVAWEAAAGVGRGSYALWGGPLSMCVGFICTDAM